MIIQVKLKIKYVKKNKKHCGNNLRALKMKNKIECVYNADGELSKKKNNCELVEAN